MSEVDRRFHETWLGMVQPVDGLVVSIPVLVDAQCAERQPPHVQQTLLELCPPTKQGDAGPEGYAISDLAGFLSSLLGLSPELFDVGDALPDELSLYVPEGKQVLRATMGLKKQGTPAAAASDATPASSAGARYEMLVWDLPRGLDLDKPETITGTWSYPPSAKLDRLLRHCRVPIGLLTNREVVRLVYAPHGESSGSITFRLDDMASVGGRPILDAFVMLLSANRFFGVTDERSLPALLAESRKRQANVTNDLADQVFEALQILLRGFEAAAERDGHTILDDALEREHDHLYKGLLTVLLRVVILLYAEDRGLLPTDHPLYAEHLSVLGLFEQLQAERGAYPDSMSRRFGAWGRLVTLFRAMYLGLEHGALTMPPRRGSLFNPHEYPFLEGWGPAGSAPITQPEARAEVKLPTVDDETVFRVLEKLLVLDGQRLSYRALDVEQIGSVYEALMGYHVVRVAADAVCMKPDRLWLTPAEVLEIPAARRAKWLKETVGLSTAQADKLGQELSAAEGPAALDALAKYAAGRRSADPTLSRARAGQLVLQPGAERRRTSSHYTPRSLSAPIVRRTLEPLLAVMGDGATAERILSLKVCDPAMGSGAFLVEACRFLADHVVAAWTKEGATEAIAAKYGDPVLHARRLVAQRCLYGVDKNEAAVELAKLSLWLVTMSRTLPFTFLDHAMRHGDSLVGLDFEQIRSGHWKPGKQMEIAEVTLREALDEAIQIREGILELASDPSPEAQREKERRTEDAYDALAHARLLADIVVGAFFAHEKDKERERERKERVDAFVAWKATGEGIERLLAWQREIRGRIPVFHWMLEFPEVFYAERPDPLDDGLANRAADMDAFLGNPPFAGKNNISDAGGPEYLDLLMATYEEVAGHPNGDLCVFFLRRCWKLLGRHGTMGFIATNSVSEGDSRLVGLRRLLLDGGKIYDARLSIPWEGDASVSVSVVHVACGRPAAFVGSPRLDGVAVSIINSRLTAASERSEAAALAANANIGFVGGKLMGVGLAVSSDEYASLVGEDPSNAEVMRPYLGGEETNRNPRGEFERHVIDFSTKTLEEARRWPTLVKLVEERVRPEREKMNRATYKTYWWRPGESGHAMYAALQGLPKCLVCATVTKHLMFSFKPTTWFLAQTLNVFALSTWTSFGVLQSRAHIAWARLLSSSMRTDLRYSTSDCFETLPFPEADPRATVSSVEGVGERVYELRASYMAADNVGLTITYNRLKDPACRDARILELRRLHEEMDRAVLDAYGWTDIEVPPYCPANDEEKRAVEAFETKVIDRLFALNAKRAEEEKVLGLGAGGKGRAGRGTKKSAVGGQGGLFD